MTVDRSGRSAGRGRRRFIEVGCRQFIRPPSDTAHHAVKRADAEATGQLLRMDQVIRIEDHDRDAKDRVGPPAVWARVGRQ